MTEIITIPNVPLPELSDPNVARAELLQYAAWAAFYSRPDYPTVYNEVLLSVDNNTEAPALAIASIVQEVGGPNPFRSDQTQVKCRGFRAYLQHSGNPHVGIESSVGLPGHPTYLTIPGMDIRHAHILERPSYNVFFANPPMDIDRPTPHDSQRLSMFLWHSSRLVFKFLDATA
jgi:hypothetical protein